MEICAGKEPGPGETHLKSGEASTTKGLGSTQRIFISCSADAQSLPVLHALIFTARICGLEPSHIGSFEAEGSTRLHKVQNLISSSQWSVHDLSDGSGNSETGISSANVPLELGMALASGGSRHTLIFARKPYDHHKFVSDLSGRDVAVHNGDPRRASRLLRDWLATSIGRPLPSSQAIWKKYRRFLTDLPNLARPMAGRPAGSLTLRQWDRILLSWLLDEDDSAAQPDAAEAQTPPSQHTGGPSSSEHSDTVSIRSAGWTGRRPLKEQLTIVRGIAPLAQQSLAQLIQTLEEKRYNDPATGEALETLRELHSALGELISRAEAERPMRDVFVNIEKHKERLTVAIREGAQVMITAPALAVGASYMLSLLSGFPVSDAMLSTLCATMMGKDALLALARHASKGPSEPSA